MLFEYRYFGATDVSSGAGASSLSFAPDTRRTPTFLSGRLRKKLPFRETISALHQVVVSDLRYRARDKSAYLAWRAQQDDVDLASMAAVRRDNTAQIQTVRAELEALRRARASRWNPFYDARKRFFDWLYKKNLDAWLVLDPVISVHPDTVSFECFSLDESSYGRLACSHEVFEQLGELAYGTTNIDYSYALFDEFQKIRDDKETTLRVDPTGFDVQTGDDEVYREVKIDLPDSWVRGFLQVGTAMALPGAVRLQLHPMDLHNLCFVLRRHKETRGPRSLRFALEPGRPAKVTIEPFGIELTFPRSTHDAASSTEIRVWGRRRLLVLERLVPVARGITVVLLGSGMPSFWVADCGDLTFTLGLSGWTANDWSSSANFDLLAPRGELDAATTGRVLDALRARWLATPAELASDLGLDRGAVESALVAFAQGGRAMYDLHRGVWRSRELTREPLELDSLRWSNDREREAAEVVARNGVRLTARAAGGGVVLEGTVGAVKASATIDADRRLVAGSAAAAGTSRTSCERARAPTCSRCGSHTSGGSARPSTRALPTLASARRGRSSWCSPRRRASPRTLRPPCRSRRPPPLRGSARCGSTQSRRPDRSPSPTRCSSHPRRSGSWRCWWSAGWSSSRRSGAPSWATWARSCGSRAT
ncbi:MAG: SWIM zinc finger family protein [Myxococcota bacterium]